MQQNCNLMIINWICEKFKYFSLPYIFLKIFTIFKFLYKLLQISMNGQEIRVNALTNHPFSNNF